MTTILYVGAVPPDGDALGLLAQEDSRRYGDGSILCVRRGQPPYAEERRFIEIADANAAVRYVQHHAVDVVILDARVGPFSTEGSNPTVGGSFGSSRAGATLAGLFPDESFATHIVRERVIGIVGDGASGAEAAFRFGRYQVGGVLTSPSLEQLLARLDRTLEGGASGGRVAVCLAGGGIEGLLYELGVLRALDAFMADRPIVDVDLFCGISAGAVLGALMANGIGPEEIARGLTGASARIDPITKRELFDPNVRELGWRSMRLTGQLVRGGWGPRGALSSIARALPNGLFAGNGLRRWMERQLSKPGMTDRFADLRRPLLIGATDQDTSEAVVFGEPPLDEVPVHRAVRASAGLVPFYAPEEIDGRYYIDGAFSRTTNMRTAVRHGASLVILIDPLVPTQSERAGYVHARGGMFATMQGLKALINGRFDKAANTIREMYPEVTFHLFRPEGDEMRILSGSPMKYFFRREIEEIAFEHTVRKLRESLPEMSRDFARHRIRFEDPTEVGGRRRAPRLDPHALGLEG